MTTTLESYLRLEAEMIELDARTDQLRDRMDSLWYSLSSEEHETLDKRTRRTTMTNAGTEFHKGPEEIFDLVWIDIETTGLDSTSDYILEIAAAVSHSDKPFEYEFFFHEVLPFPDIYLHTLDPFVLETHSKSGLLRESLALRSSVNAARDRQEKQIKLFESFFRQLPSGLLQDVPKVLAGSTVHFDRKFLERQSPGFKNLFIHRHYDVSSIKLFCQSLGMKKIPKGEAHRAKADIEESVSHAKMCAEWLESWFHAP